MTGTFCVSLFVYAEILVQTTSESLPAVETARGLANIILRLSLEPVRFSRSENLCDSHVVNIFVKIWFV